MKKTLASTSQSRAPFTAAGRRRLVGLAILGLFVPVALLSLSLAPRAKSAGGPVAVSVANTPLTTISTDLAGPAQPFQHLFQVESENSGRTYTSITVPAHKRLVIEYISSSLNEYPSGGGGYVYMNTTAGGETVYYYLTDTISDFNKRNQSVHIYADPGTTVTVGANSSNGASGIGTDTEISGYYVNVP